MHVTDVEIEMVADDTQYLNDDTDLINTVQFKGSGVGDDVLLFSVFLQTLQVPFDGRLCFSRSDDAEPLALRFLGRGREDLHLVGTPQYIRDRYGLVVHLSSDTMFAQVGVNHIGKVQDGRVLREGFYLTLWGEDEYLVGKEIELEVIQEGHRIRVRVL